MSTRPPPSVSSLPSGHAGAIALALTTLVALTLVAFSMIVEFVPGTPAVNWPLFGLMAGLLLICERWPRTWIGTGSGGAITPTLLFGFAMILLGSPASALAVSLLGVLVHATVDREDAWQRVARFARVAASIATGGLVLSALGVRGAVTQFDSIPWDWAAAIIVSGISILLMDAVVTEITGSARRRVGFVAPLRRSIGARVVAQGSLLSLAPIWVLGIDESLVLTPLLGISTLLVFASTRHALEREHEADHDALTGLGNRRALADALRDALSGVGAPAAGAVLLMDLDGFKEVNDRLGHDVGDALLIAFANRLERCVPGNAQVTRLGGDEFAVLLTWTKRFDDVTELVRGLHHQLVAPLDIQGFPVSLGVSIGIAMVPEDGNTPDALLRAADVAMYRAKRFGTQVEHYQADGTSGETGRLELLADLGNAVRAHELRVDYQPQVNMRTGHIDAVEALVRWQHPVHGTIAPNAFIGLAEQTDLIGEITDTVLRMAAGGLLLSGAADVRLSLNVSVKSLQDHKFATHVLAVIEEIGFPPDRLEMEVTESALITNADRVRDTVDQLHAAGVRITLDGFGTGYASYQTLRTLPVDRVKIDRDFILQLLSHSHDQVIVQSVVSLAHALDLEVIAEGVESTDTWDALVEMGCDSAQGFGIAVPMAMPELRNWLTDWYSLPSHWTAG